MTQRYKTHPLYIYLKQNKAVSIGEIILSISSTVEKGILNKDQYKSASEYEIELLELVAAYIGEELLQNEKVNLENEITKVKQDNLSYKLERYHTYTSKLEFKDTTTEILKEREVELLEANNKVKDLETELDTLKSKDQSLSLITIQKKRKL